MEFLKYVIILLSIFAFSYCSPDNPDNPKDNQEQNEPGDDTPGGGGAVTPPPAVTNVLETIFAESFDHNTSYSGYMTSGDWSDASGTGAATVTYNAWNAGIYNNNHGSAGAYDGASGGCYANIYQSGSGVYGYYTINGISTGTYKNFRLRFGAIQTSEVLTLEVCHDGSTWTPLQYSNGEGYNSWGRAEICFSVLDGNGTLSLKFTAAQPKSDYAYGGKLDDILLQAVDTEYETVLKSKEEEVDNPGLKKRYAELPAVDNDNPDYYYNTLYTKTVSSKKHVRNYSFCYDTRRHNPIWVAFPMHSIYAEGSGRSRDDNGNDPWMKYPDLDDGQQSIIYDITKDGSHMFWSNSASQGRRQDGDASVTLTWTKGHLCMSSSRSGAGEEINLQTFYPVNIAPQPNQYSGLFSTIWGLTEDFHWQRGSQICPDTLYVVTGCKYADDTWIEYDATDWGDRCDYSKPCVIPTHQFKVFLRTREGDTGKPVHQCSASELKTIGFWMDIFIPGSSSTSLADYAVSVAQVERLTGLTFFPDIPSEVKEQCNPEDWGLD